MSIHREDVKTDGVQWRSVVGYMPAELVLTGTAVKIGSDASSKRWKEHCFLNHSSH